MRRRTGARFLNLRMRPGLGQPARPAGGHIVTARMPGQDADHIPALPGAQADQPYVPGGGMIELSRCPCTSSPRRESREPGSS